MVNLERKTRECIMLIQYNVTLMTQRTDQEGAHGGFKSEHGGECMSIILLFLIQWYIYLSTFSTYDF